jgi:membrane protein DedA with SNARE-associated domain
MFFSLQKIIALLITFKYVIIFPIAVIEGPAVSILAGYLAQEGYFNVYFVYALIVFGDMVGDGIYYAIGRFGGLYFIRKWNHFFKIDTMRLISLEKTFNNHGPKLLFIGKTQGLGSLILMSAGLAKYRFWPYMCYNTLATLLKSFILLYLGYVFGKQYASANDYIFKFGVIMSFAFIIAVYFYFRKKPEEL